MTNIDLRSKVISGLRWATISRSLMQLMTWAATLLVVRLLTPTDYGLVTMATIISTYLMLLGELGFSVALVQRQTVDDHTLRCIFGALLVVGVTLFAATLASAPLVAHYFSEPVLSSLTSLVAVQFLFMPLTVIPQARLSIDMRFRTMGMIGIASAFVSAAGTLILAYVGMGPYSLVLGTLLSALTRVAAMNAAAPFLKVPKWDLQAVRSFMSFSGFVTTERTIWYWYAQADAVVVGSKLGTPALGIYSVAKQLATMPLDRFAEIMNMIALPAFASVKNDTQRVLDGYLKSMRLACWLVFPSFWGIALVANDLIHLIIGDKWNKAIPIFQLLCCAMPFRTIASLAPPAVTALGRPDVPLKSILWAAGCIPVAMLVGSHWGLTGVAAGWAIAYPIAFVGGSYHVSHAFHSSIPVIFRPLWRPIACALLMSAALLILRMFLHLGTAPNLVVSVFTGAVFYAAVSWLCAKQELLEAIGFLRALFSR